MGKVIFKDPNGPEQPAPGVYRWSYAVEGKKRPLYVGQSGAGQHGVVRYPSTLSRGTSQLSREQFSSDGGRSLDTDFIIGTAIMYLKKRGLDCIWEHIHNDPGRERDFCLGRIPALQDDRGRIRGEFRLTRSDGEPWNGRNKDHVRKAEAALFELFAEILGV